MQPLISTKIHYVLIFLRLFDSYFFYVFSLISVSLITLVVNFFVLKF